MIQKHLKDRVGSQFVGEEIKIDKELLLEQRYEHLLRAGGTRGFLYGVALLGSLWCRLVWLFGGGGGFYVGSRVANMLWGGEREREGEGEERRRKVDGGGRGSGGEEGEREEG